MASPGYLFSACGSNDMRDCLSTLSTLAWSHATAGEKFDLVAITVAIIDSLAYLAGGNFLTATDNSVIIRHSEQLSRYMKE